MPKKKKPYIQKVNETTAYCIERPTRKQMAEDIKWIRLKFLRQNLARASRRGEHTKEIDITLDDLYEIGEKQDWKCAMTGVPLEFTRGGSFENGTNPNSCTIDRHYNTTGYLDWNVQLTIWSVNSLKRSLSTKEFIKMCNLVANHIDNR